MKCIVIYQSKTGFTKKYAKWIQEELYCHLKDYKTVTKKMLSKYDVIIFGSYIRVERFRGWNHIKALTGADRTKKLILFATGAGEPEEERIEAMWKSSVPEKELQAIPHFYMRSGLNYEKMGLGERLLMKGFGKVMNRKNKKKTGTVKVDMTHSYDLSSKEYMKALTDYVKEHY